MNAVMLRMKVDPSSGLKAIGSAVPLFSEQLPEKSVQKKEKEPSVLFSWLVLRDNVVGIGRNIGERQVFESSVEGG
jgi:hypothetical protein